MLLNKIVSWARYSLDVLPRPLSSLLFTRKGPLRDRKQGEWGKKFHLNQKTFRFTYNFVLYKQDFFVFLLLKASCFGFIAFTPKVAENYEKPRVFGPKENKPE